MDQKFEILPLKQELLENLRGLKFTSMTPIQAKSLPLMLEGKDIIAQAKTGSGKTAAFGLCLLNSLDLAQRSLHSLILCPTRELAEQVAGEIKMLARAFQNTRVLTLCGGFSATLQQKGLESGPHIVVGTPGRVLQHLEKGALNLDSLNIFTLDEADRMLDMGFHDQIMEIVSYLPKKRQSLLFSATYPDNIKNLSSEIQRNAVEIKTDVAHEADDIDQVFFEVLPSQDKNDFLYKILSSYRPDRALVFCKTKKDTTDVAQFLINRKISAECINGDLEQNDRTEILEKFSNRSLSILVATDVAARGLDIEDLAAVINYNMPSSAEAYVHRIGRTGRAGKKGLVFSFFSQNERDQLESIESLTLKPCQLEDVAKLKFSKKYDLIPPMQTMYISGGKKDKLRPGDIVGALVGEAKINASDIGDISIHNSFTFVAIKTASIHQAIQKLKVGKIKKKKFKVGLA